VKLSVNETGSVVFEFMAADRFQPVTTRRTSIELRDRVYKLVCEAIASWRPAVPGPPAMGRERKARGLCPATLYLNLHSPGGHVSCSWDRERSREFPLQVQRLAAAVQIAYGIEKPFRCSRGRADVSALAPISLPEHPFEDIWNGPEARAFRNRANTAGRHPYCVGCYYVDPARRATP